jgi:hypothetical protein
MRTLFIASSIVIASAFLSACDEEPATVFPPDAGAPAADAGRDSGAPAADAGLDAGPRDAGMDAQIVDSSSPPPDAGDEEDAS